MSDAAKTRREKAEARVERGFAAWMQTLVTILAYTWLGPWFAFGYMVGLLILTVSYGLYAFGLSRGAA